MIEERHTAPRSRVPDLLVEKLLLGELAPDKAARVRAELEAEPHGLERVEELRRSNSEILFQYPPRSVVHAIEARGGIRRNRRSKLFVILPTLVASAAALALYIRTDTGPTHSVVEDGEHLTAKGPPRVVIHRRGLDGTPELKDGQIVHANDELQLSYLSMDWRFGVIFSIDGRGSVTLHYPAQPGDPETLESKNQSGRQEVPLKNSYKLDDAPAFERFFIVGNNAPIDIQSILNQARQLASDPHRAAEANLDLPRGVQQSSVLLRKESP